MNCKKYEITYELCHSIVVEIDHDIMTDEILHQINSFWGDEQYRLNMADGDIVQAVLKMLGEFILRLTVEYNYSTQGIIDLFNWDSRYGGQEGWPKMDGSTGIRIVSVEEFTFAESGFDVKEVA